MGIEIRLKRSATYGIGKQMADAVYVHIQYEHVLPQGPLTKAKKLLPIKFVYNIVKYNQGEKKISFIYSPDFDKANEPLVGPYVVVHFDGTIRQYPNKRSEPMVYHHKWLMVGEDYTGFSIEKAKKRSADTYDLHVNKYKIGYKSYWDGVLRRNSLPK